MSQFIYRIVFLLFVVAGAIRLSAQTPASEAGIWIIDTRLAGEGDVDFDEKIGFGLSFNHYWTERVSTEISWQELRADTLVDHVIITGFCGFGELTPVQPQIVPAPEIDPGRLEVTAVTAMAQLHFNREGRLAPYVGAGVAHLSGDLSFFDTPNAESFELESEITWAASAGVDLRLTDRLFLAGEVKFIPWSAIAEDDPDSESLDIDPLIMGVGVKMRF